MILINLTLINICISINFANKFSDHCERGGGGGASRCPERVMRCMSKKEPRYGR